jgi:lactate permease
LAVILAMAAWGMTPVWVAAAGLAGLMNALEILVIVFGALLILQLLRRSGGIKSIAASMAQFSSDRRVQLILIAWLMGSFLEGAAGFGTPAAVTAPLLVGLGFPAFPAVVGTLIADSTSVSFGAVGVPIWGGFANLEALFPSQAGMSFLGVLHRIGAFSGLVHFAIGTFIPLVIVAILTRTTAGSFRPGLKIWPLAIAGGLAFTIPQTLIALWIGPEMPALLGSLIGLAIFLFLVSRGWLVPKETWDFPARHTWPEKWGADAKIRGGEGQHHSIGPLWAWMPYFLISFLLLVSRISAFGIAPWLKAWTISWNHILGTSLSRSIAPLNNPGIFPFLLVALLIPLFHRLPQKEIRAAWNDTLHMIRPAAIALSFTLAMVYTMMNAGQATGRDSMLIELAKVAAAGLGRFWYLIAPFVGILGSFISGSNTVSNIMFGALQLRTAEQARLALIPVLGLQVVGGAAGNVISIHHVVAVLTTVGLVGREGAVIRENLPVVLGYGLLAGIVGWLLVVFGGVW